MRRLMGTENPPLIRGALEIVQKGTRLLRRRRQVVVLPNGGPGGHADPKLAGELESIVNVGHQVRHVDRRRIAAGRIRQIHVLPVPQVHPEKEHPVQAHHEQDTLADPALIDLS